MEYRVLLPIDADDDRVLAQARTVANLAAAASETKVTLLHVFDHEGEDEPHSIREIEAGERIATALEEREVSFDEMIRLGDPAEAILAAASDIGADMILLGGRKHGPIGNALFGSVSQTVIRHAERPVTITGDTPPMAPTHVCQSCGKRYYAPGTGEIDTCEACGGTAVDAVD